METAPESPAGEPGVGVLAWVGLVGAATLAASFAGDGADVGGILPVGGSAVALLAAALVAFAAGRLSLPRLGRVGVGLLASATLLAVWTGVTMVWSIVPDRSWNVFDKTIAYVAFLGLGVVIAGIGGGKAARLGAFLLAATTGIVLAYALLAKAIPALDAQGDHIARLHVPIGYWNALALLADIALPLGTWLGVTKAHRTGVRVAGGLLVYVATLALLLTLSRAGLAAALLVVALWLVLCRERIESGALLVASSGPAVLVAAWAFTRPALVHDGAPRADRVSDGAVFAELTVAGAFLVVALVYIGLQRELDERRRRTARRWLLVLVAVGVAAALLAGVAAVGNPAAWARHQISASKACRQVANSANRLGSLSANGRLCWWKEAWRVFAANDPEGAGAGSFEVARKRYRIDAGTVVEPHSVPMQELADGGVAALALFLALVGSGAAGCVSAIRRVSGTERAAAVALVCAPVAYLVHSLVDFSWDFLATTAPTMVALGVLAGIGRPVLELRPRPLLGVVAVLVGLAVLGSFASPRISSSAVGASTDALGYHHLAKARDRARWARFFNPLSIDPIFALAAVDELEHLGRAALARYVQAVDLQPENPDTWYALGLYEFQARGDMCHAYEYFNNAYTLDPRGAEWVKGGYLDQSRNAVNHGACEKQASSKP